MKALFHENLRRGRWSSENAVVDTTSAKQSIQAASSDVAIAAVTVVDGWAERDDEGFEAINPDLQVVAYGVLAEIHRKPIINGDVPIHERQMAAIQLGLLGAQ